MNQETEELAQGSVVGGYRVMRLLGAGGMSRVYEVVHEKLGTHFALKVFARAEKGMSLSCANASWPRDASLPGSSLHGSCVYTTSLNCPPANRAT